MSRETPVDGETIHNVAQRHEMGAGALKGALEGLDGFDDMADIENASLASAVEEALEAHGSKAAQEHRDEWEGTIAYSVEFDEQVRVERVHDQHADEVADDVQPVSVTTTEGVEETTSLDSLNHDTSGPASAFADQSVTCGACEADTTTETILNVQTGRVYWTCPECGTANARMEADR